MTLPRTLLDPRRPLERKPLPRFPRQSSSADTRRFVTGRHFEVQRLLGARVHTAYGVTGVLFTVWAPNARRVSVVGDFNEWDAGPHPMRMHAGGVWELFIPELAAGACYKFEIESAGGDILLKTDPCGRRFQLRPDTAAIVEAATAHAWQDAAWVAARRRFRWKREPISIYEVHLGSWLRSPENEVLNYREIAPRLVAHARALGFTHVELLPITEHPYDQSWGYQTTGYFAPTSRFGTPDEFRWFVDHCHTHGIGIILDWVPAHFPKDPHGLACFDGSMLYEHDDPHRREKTEWTTLVFNHGRREVRNFLLSSALFWLRDFHLDGLRVDAVASMLALEPGRYGEPVPVHDPGNDNLEGIAFLRELTAVAHRLAPGALIMAEDSSARPGVTSPTSRHGLGFDLKWNMGWMNDVLSYVGRPAGDRPAHQNELTFSLSRARDENFLLPLAHDEVVHGKRSLRHRMPGDEWQRFANLRLLYLYQYTHPGKKLLFMGDEFGQGAEWNSQRMIDWYLRAYPMHDGLLRLVTDLNGLYRAEPGLHASDFDGAGFEWIDGGDAPNAIIVFARRFATDILVVALNFKPVPHFDYRIGLPADGTYEQLMSSDATDYGGSGISNGGMPMHADAVPCGNRQYSMAIALPPLGGCVLKRVGPASRAGEHPPPPAWRPLPTAVPAGDIPGTGGEVPQ